ncbi:FHA domain-containing protein [Pelotomaculum propionicicum]|uniref:FHA domain-containing protein n=1 Tax=Pelotomaculum propionicicum TaxID=258475 RepID=UPI003B797D14
MSAVLLLILRYAFLLLLVIFITRLVKWMVSDLLTEQAPHPVGQLEKPEKKEINETAASRLVVINSSSPDLQCGDTFLIDRDIVLGRGGGCNILIKDTFASNQHARVFVRKGQYWLEDMGSTNGTFVNEVQVKQPVVLADGDRIRVGSVTFQFVRWGHEMGLYN